MWILQISDVHLAEEKIFPVPAKDILRSMWTSIQPAIDPSDTLIVVICGDLTSKGDSSGYRLAQRFFKDMEEIFNIKLLFCLCPGNHDIENGSRDFSSFNVFSWELSQRQECLFDRNQTASILTLNGIDFLLTNSAHHGDHTFGLVDLPGVVKALRNRSSRPLAVLTHHHLIPIHKGDKSATANAYPFLQVVLAARPCFLLHGHIHQEQGLLAGAAQCAIVGGGSLLRPLGENFNCQFNLLHLSAKGLSGCRYRFVADMPTKEGIGGFLALPLTFA